MASLAAAFAAARRAEAADGYILAMSWQPAFCAARGSVPECKLSAHEAPRLVLHGLWPDWDIDGDGKRNDGDAFCIDAAEARGAIQKLDGQGGAGGWLKLPPVKLSTATARDLAGVMPGVAAGLDRHEWWKHGTCSGLAAEDYFAAAIVLALQVDRGALARLIAQKAGAEVERKALLDAFETEFGAKSARALVLDCRKDGAAAELVEIRIRLQRGRIAEGLNAGSLDQPGKPAKGDCPARIRIQG